jgi:hypothetical protein
MVPSWRALCRVPKDAVVPFDYASVEEAGKRAQRISGKQASAGHAGASKLAINRIAAAELLDSYHVVGIPGLGTISH